MGQAGKYYIIHGSDDLRRGRLIDQLRRELKGEPAIADLNTHRLDGRQLTMGELRHVCNAAPFLADRRMVIVDGLLSRLASERRGRDQEPAPGEEPAWKRTFVKELMDYLPRLPESTRLLFVEARSLEDSHPILKFARSQGERQGAYIRQYQAPEERDLPAWIQQQAAERNGRISEDGAVLLAELIGTDLRLLDLEIDKLVAYADGQLITRQEVETLVSRTRGTNVFDLVTCIGRHQTDRALQLLHGLLDDGDSALAILAMLARQVRLLIQVSVMQRQGASEAEMAKRLGLPLWLPRRLQSQSQSFTMVELERMHQLLVETDQKIKTGGMDEALALDLLVVDLMRR